MIAVIFEVKPRPDRQAEYLDVAADLRPLLEDIDGFISIERFNSLLDPGKILSLSFWRNEAAIREWRNVAAHRHAQASGRGHMFENYNIRVAKIIRDYGMLEREQAPLDSQKTNP